MSRTCAVRHDDLGRTWRIIPAWQDSASPGARLLGAVASRSGPGAQPAEIARAAAKTLLNLAFE
jgi:hypothetical protein